MISDAIRSRRSIRRFRPDAPPPELLEELVRAASMAPSASNKQPWRFVAVQNRDVISSVAQAVRDAVRESSACVDEQMRATYLSYSNYFSGFEDAPVVIVVLFRKMNLLSNMLTCEATESVAINAEKMENNSGLIGASLAIGNLLLTAHENGLGATCMSGPILAEDRIRGILSMQPSWQLAAIIPVGYPAEEPQTPERKPVERILKWIK